MNAKASPRQLVMSLQPGQHGLMYHPGQPTKCMCQISRDGNAYYLVGPQFRHYTAVELRTLFKLGLRDGMSVVDSARFLNETLRKRGVPPEAHVFECNSQVDALETLSGLFAAYSLG